MRQPSNSTQPSKAERLMKKALSGKKKIFFSKEKPAAIACIISISKHDPAPRDQINTAIFGTFEEIPKNETDVQNNMKYIYASAREIKIRRLKSSDSHESYVVVLPIDIAYLVLKRNSLPSSSTQWLGLTSSGNRRGWTIPRSEERVYMEKSDIEQSLTDIRIDGEVLSDALRLYNSNHQIEISGAWIDGNIDLRAAVMTVPMLFEHCVISGIFIAVSARLDHISFHSCEIYQFNGDGCDIRSSLFIRNSTIVKRDVRLVSAKFGKDVDFTGAIISGFLKDESVHLGNARIGGSFIAQNAQFEGTIALNGATVDGNVDLRESIAIADETAVILDSISVGGSVALGFGFQSSGCISIARGRIERDLDFTFGTLRKSGNDEYVISCDGTFIGGVLFLRGMTTDDGIIKITHTKTYVLSDADLKCWENSKKIEIDGLVYERLDGDIDIPARIKWLKKSTSSIGIKFSPGPWRQLAEVLDRSDHKNQAKFISIAKENWRRKIGSLNKRGNLIHLLWGASSGYGYLPGRVLSIVITAWISLSALYWCAEKYGAFGPSSPIVFTNQEITKYCGIPNRSQTSRTAWTSCPSLPPEHTTFNAFIYSADLILPLVDLQQEKDWAPIVTLEDGVTTFWPGAIARWAMWTEIVLGWMTSLALAAVISGLAKRES